MGSGKTVRPRRKNALPTRFSKKRTEKHESMSLELVGICWLIRIGDGRQLSVLSDLLALSIVIPLFVHFYTSIKNASHVRKNSILWIKS